MGADTLTLKTAQFYDYEHGNDLMPSNSKYSRYTFDVKSGCYRPKNRYKSLKDVPCRRLWKGCVIDVHGNMFPCCFDKEGQYSFGNLVQSSLDDVWFSNQALLFRQSVTQDRMQYNICTNCTE
jgi:radical SAM protein with 4Fe4S-binding SPASM domain